MHNARRAKSFRVYDAVNDASLPPTRVIRVQTGDVAVAATRTLVHVTRSRARARRYVVVTANRVRLLLTQ